MPRTTKTTTSDPKATYLHGSEGWEITIPLNPVPAARPRTGKWGTYYPKNYATWKARTDDMLELIGHTSPRMTEETLYVSVDSVVQRPPTGTLVEPNGDVDNYAKAALDAITKSQILWYDDKQVKLLIAHKRYSMGGEQPRTVIRAGLTMGVLWLMEPIVASNDIMDQFDRVPMEELDNG